MKLIVSRSGMFGLGLASLVAITLAGPAQADRKGAPIIFAEQGKATEAPAKAAPATTEPAREVDGRIQFVYPGGDMPSAAPQPVASESMDPVVAAADTETNPKVIVPSKPIRIASLQTQAPAKTGQPLTLSRVAVNRAATITEERGRAGVYTEGFDGKPTANGEIFKESAMSAAHPSLPLPSLVQVTNEENGREVVVRVNDRGPFDGKRVMELSPRAADVLGINRSASANVKLRYLGPAPVQKNEQEYASREIQSEPLPPVVQPQAVQRVASVARPSPTPVRSYSPSVATAGNIYIQAGAFSDISNAQSLTTALGRAQNVKIEEARVNGGDYFRVLIGPFRDRDAAEVHRAQLSNAGIVEGFITTR